MMVFCESYHAMLEGGKGTGIVCLCLVIYEMNGWIGLDGKDGMAHLS
jgi:hypothetical protein